MNLPPTAVYNAPSMDQIVILLPLRPPARSFDDQQGKFYQFSRLFHIIDKSRYKYISELEARLKRMESLLGGDGSNDASLNKAMPMDTSLDQSEGVPNGTQKSQRASSKISIVEGDAQIDVYGSDYMESTVDQGVSIIIITSTTAALMFLGEAAST